MAKHTHTNTYILTYLHKQIHTNTNAHTYQYKHIYSHIIPKYIAPHSTKQRSTKKRQIQIKKNKTIIQKQKKHIQIYANTQHTEKVEYTERYAQLHWYTQISKHKSYKHKPTRHTHTHTYTNTKVNIQIYTTIHTHTQNNTHKEREK